MNKNQNSIASMFMDKKLIRSLRILLLTILIMLILAIVNIIENPALWWYGMLGIFAGYIIGRMFFYRQKAIEFDEESLRVVSKMDWIGIMWLILSLSLDIGKKWVLSFWFPDYLVSVLGSSLIAGIMVGRLAKNIKQIKKLIKQIS